MPTIHHFSDQQPRDSVTNHPVKQGDRWQFYQLLQERNEHPERSSEIDRRIQEQFTVTYAIFVLDMAGFSRTTVKYGIIHFLAMFHRVTTIAVPIIQAHQGKVVKIEADNIFAVFPKVDQAVNATTTIFQHMTAVNTGLPNESDIYASVGIGYGDVLMIDDSDMYGHEMNLACKLGEDLARPSEILLTAAAAAQLHPSTMAMEQLDLAISGIETTAYRLLFVDPLRLR